MAFSPPSFESYGSDYGGRAPPFEPERVRPVIASHLAEGPPRILEHAQLRLLQAEPFKPPQVVDDRPLLAHAAPIRLRLSGKSDRRQRPAAKPSLRSSYIALCESGIRRNRGCRVEPRSVPSESLGGKAEGRRRDRRPSKPTEMAPRGVDSGLRPDPPSELAPSLPARQRLPTVYNCGHRSDSMGVLDDEPEILRGPL
jgi:hypothetical protein